jgi:hypothetical protein
VRAALARRQCRRALLRARADLTWPSLLPSTASLLQPRSQSRNPCAVDVEGIPVLTDMSAEPVGRPMEEHPVEPPLGHCREERQELGPGERCRQSSELGRLPSWCRVQYLSVAPTARHRCGARMSSGGSGNPCGGPALEKRNRASRCWPRSSPRDGEILLRSVATRQIGARAERGELP